MAEIREIPKQRLNELIPLYKGAFTVHNIFTKDDNFILDYLNKVEGKFIGAFDNDKIIAALLIDKKDYNGHVLAKFKHIAVDKEYREKGVGSDLLKKAEQLVGKGKIEINVSENEKETIEFYKKNGYEQEAELKSHYRENENCFIMGKVFK